MPTCPSHVWKWRGSKDSTFDVDHDFSHAERDVWHGSCLQTTLNISPLVRERKRLLFDIYGCLLCFYVQKTCFCSCHLTESCRKRFECARRQPPILQGPRSYHHIQGKPHAWHYLHGERLTALWRTPLSHMTNTRVRPLRLAGPPQHTGQGRWRHSATSYRAAELHQKQPYTDRLRHLRLPSLEHRWRRGDIIGAVRYISGIYQVKNLNFTMAT